MNTEQLFKATTIICFIAAFIGLIYIITELRAFSSIKEFFQNVKYGAEDILEEHRTRKEEEKALVKNNEWEESEEYDEYDEDTSYGKPKTENSSGFFDFLWNFHRAVHEGVQEVNYGVRTRQASGISPERLISLREHQKGFTGVYIIYNYSKDMYYVGQAQNVYVRCSNHFLGKGNADIYADYKYGDEFFIEFESLVESGYDNLDDLERYYINRYDAVRRGYNKKRGNR